MSVRRKLRRLSNSWPLERRGTGVDKDTGLCAKCQAIVPTDATFGSGDLPEPPVFESDAGVALDLKMGYFYLPYKRSDDYPELSSITYSAENGCIFCETLAETIRIDRQVHDYRWRALLGNSRRIFIKLRYYCDSELGMQTFGKEQWPTMLSSLQACISTNASTEYEHLVLTFQVYGDDGQSLEGLFLCFYADGMEDSKVAHYLRIHRRLTESKTLCRRNLAMLRGWMHECSTTHENCRPKKQDWLPSRLIRIDDTEKGLTARLVSSKWLRARNTQYIALSYCWGRILHTRMKTTRANLRERKYQIPWDEIPPLFRDAFKAVRKLDLHYIWIDSLCIIQDDKRDWRLEAAKMGDIYRNAFLTIATVSANSTDEGFLLREKPYKATQLPFASSRNPNVKGHFYVQFSGEYDDEEEFRHDVEKSRWNERGWTFQERLLSRRIIFFGRNLLHFECREHRRSENYSGAMKRDIPWYQVINAKKEWRVLRASWRDVVLDYTSRKFTYNRDKMVALSGLVADISESMRALGQPIKYLAGHWMQDVCEELLWTSSDPWSTPLFALTDYDKRRLSEKTEEATDTCTAPTWSWCSNRGLIAWLPLRPRPTEDFKPECVIKYVIRTRRFSQLHLDQPDDSALQIEGFVLKDNISLQQQRVRSGERIVQEWNHPESSVVARPAASVTIDIDWGLPELTLNYVKEKGVRLAALGQSKYLSDIRVIGLALIPEDITSDQNPVTTRFQRVGVFQTRDGWMFKKHHFSVYKIV